jgi:hypothetical protein|tara:strand:+ start:1963 stop:2439 length:477 start_codon:yes stop_codon:yes gene_type:complete
MMNKPYEIKYWSDAGQLADIVKQGLRLDKALLGARLADVIDDAIRFEMPEITYAAEKTIDETALGVVKDTMESLLIEVSCIDTTKDVCIAVMNCPPYSMQGSTLSGKGEYQTKVPLRKAVLYAIKMYLADEEEPSTSYAVHIVENLELIAKQARAKLK